MEGLERLQLEVEEMNDFNVSNIWEYLKNRQDMHIKFNNAEKSINQMYEYICNKARKQSKNNVAIVADRIVYLWAVTYFNRSNEELDLNKKSENLTPTKPKNEEKKEDKEVQEKQNTIKTEDNQTSLFQEVDK